MATMKYAEVIIHMRDVDMAEGVSMRVALRS